MKIASPLGNQQRRYENLTKRGRGRFLRISAMRSLRGSACSAIACANPPEGLKKSVPLGCDPRFAVVELNMLERNQPMRE